jgi:hypothetical protein
MYALMLLWVIPMLKAVLLLLLVLMLLLHLPHLRTRTMCWSAAVRPAPMGWWPSWRTWG